MDTPQERAILEQGITTQGKHGITICAAHSGEGNPRTGDYDMTANLWSESQTGSSGEGNPRTGDYDP